MSGNASAGLVAHWVLVGGPHEGNVVEVDAALPWIGVADPIEASSLAAPAGNVSIGTSKDVKRTIYRREIVTLDGWRFCIGLDMRLTCGPVELARAFELIRRVRLAPIGTHSPFDPVPTSTHPRD